MTTGNDPFNGLLGTARNLGRHANVRTPQVTVPRSPQQLAGPAGPLLHREDTEFGNDRPSPPEAEQPPGTRPRRSTAVAQRQLRLLVTGLLMALAGVIVTGAAFLPWFAGPSGKLAASLNGLDGRIRWYFSGWPALGAGIVMLILGAVAATVRRTAWAFTVGLVAAVVAGGVGLAIVVRGSTVAAQLPGSGTEGLAATGAGVGPWLTVFGAVLCIIAGVAGLVAGSRR